MQFKPYKKPDGTEELRLKPESPEDCDSIDDCSKCFFEDSNESFDDFLRKLGAEPFDLSGHNNSSLKLVKKPNTRSLPHISIDDLPFISIKDLIKGIYNSPPEAMTKVMSVPFTVVNGKVEVIADPETKKLMEELGIVEKLERMIREEEDEN